MASIAMILVPLLACLWFTIEARQGAYECPCITNTSAQYMAIQTSLENLGKSNTYGIGGCQAHDENNSAEGCASNENAYCLKSWCYVDMELCPIDESRCAEEGGKVGSAMSPHCRTRNYEVSKDLGSDFSYSYETCGGLNMYDTGIVQLPLANKALTVAVDAWPPWIVKKKASGFYGLPFGGALYDFFIDTLNHFNPRAEMLYVPGWATESSRALFSSSYTACVHDVAVGNFDICVADLWITPERMQLSSFTPAVRFDYFYLVSPKTFEEDTLASRLAKPFAPFTPAAWGLVVAFVLGTWAIVALLRVWHGARAAFAENGIHGVKFVVGEVCHAFFDVNVNFLQGAVHQSGPENSWSNQIFMTALAFFGLVILASYTASLASLIIVDRMSVGTIKNLEDAIARDIPVCVPAGISRPMSKLYPRGSFFEIGVQEDAPRTLYSGACGAAIITEGVIDNMHGGNLKESDCKKVTDGDWTEAEGHCQTGLDGRARNDCDLMRVGDIIFTMPIGFPVSQRLQHSLAWAFTKLTLRGDWEEKLKLNDFAFPKSECEVEQKTEEDGLDAAALSGTMLISVFILALGVFVLICEIIYKRIKSCTTARNNVDNTLDGERDEPAQVKPETKNNTVVV